MSVVILLPLASLYCTVSGGGGILAFLSVGIYRL